MTRATGAWTPVLFAVFAAASCTPQTPGGTGATRQGDCGAERAGTIAAAREAMDARVPSGRAVFRGSARVCGLDEHAIAVGREPALAEGRSTRASATVFFTPTVLVGDPGQELALTVVHDGRTKTHSFTSDELGIEELLFSSDEADAGTETTVTVRFPSGRDPILFHCRFHRTGGMWGALVAR